MHTIENLYPYSNAIDLIADNYDSNSYLTLNSCVIKTSVKEKAKDILKSVTDYCDLNVNKNIICLMKKRKTHSLFSLSLLFRIIYPQL